MSATAEKEEPQVQQKPAYKFSYRPDIDGLRAIAVIIVVIFHAFPKAIKGGFVGVDIFFVISGYLISSIIFCDLFNGRFSFIDFYVRRVRRIFPVLSVVLLSCLGLGWLVLVSDELNQLGKHVAAGAGFVANLALWAEAGYFDNSAVTKPLLHLWSLGIEEQFYLVWPLILWAAWKKRFNAFYICLAIAVVSFAWNLYWFRTNPTADYYAPQTRFWELLFGAMLAWGNLHWKEKITAKFDGTRLGAVLPHVLSVSGVALLVASAFLIREKHFPGWQALIPVVATVAVIMAGEKGILNKWFLSNKVMVWIGLISYPLYLWHWPLFSFANIVKDGKPSRDLMLILIAVSFVLAWLTVRFIEKPFRFGKENVRLKVIILYAAVATVGVLGFVQYKADLTSRTLDKTAVKRAGAEHAVGYSTKWFRGKDDWLFLGNSYGNMVAKLKMAVTPSKKDIGKQVADFAGLAKTAGGYGIPVVLLVGPNKSSVYPEYLPDGIVPATARYSRLLTDPMKNVPNLTVYDPTDDLIAAKKTQGILYWRTDSHWNDKGAFIAYEQLAKRMNVPVPAVSFEPAGVYRGETIPLTGLDDFPLHPGDHWKAVWKNEPVTTMTELVGEETPFGRPRVVTNAKPLTGKTVWVIGDSFTVGIVPYLNATFAEVRYVGHANQLIGEMKPLLDKAKKKPDFILVVRVERAF